MSEKCGEYDEAGTYLIWVRFVSRKGKLYLTVPRLVVFLFNVLLLPFGDTATDYWATYHEYSQNLKPGLDDRR